MRRYFLCAWAAGLWALPCLVAGAQFDPNGGLGFDFDHLEQIDANGDGEVTFEEFQAVFPDSTEEMFIHLDRNGDGVLSLEDLEFGLEPPPELLPLLIELLEAADTNDDGVVSFEEARDLFPDLGEERFHHLDRNGDGVLSREDLELPPPESHINSLLELFRDADANNDGVVSFEELQAIHPDVSLERFDALDRNGDGVLSGEDLPAPRPEDPSARLLRLLHEADANGDGAVTLDELRAIHPDFSEDAFARLDLNGDGVLSREDLPDAPPAGPHELLLRLLREADANGDGEVTFEELHAMAPEAAEAHFDRLDQNGDGVLSRADLDESPNDPVRRLLYLIEQADANGDDVVTFDELTELFPELTPAQFESLDRNGDGMLSVEDLPEAPESNGTPRTPGSSARERLLRLLHEADADGDGELTFDELLAVMSDLTQERFDRLDRNGDGVLSLADLEDGPMPSGDDARQRLLHLLVTADANHDGALDFAEIAFAFPDAPAELLAQIDANGDWVITRDELMGAMGHDAEGNALVRSHDIDASGATNSVDLQLAINQALGRAGNTLPADIDGDGWVNAVDVQKVLNAILNGE